MARNIFRVDAWTIDSTGAYHGVTNYPKNFDSNNYTATASESAVDIAFKRADGDASTVWADFCTKDNRQIQTVTLSDISGNLIYKKSMGGFPVEQV